MSKNRTEQPNIASSKIDVLEKDEIFVFGSNLAGHHKGGAARAANMKFGAEWGVGVGLTGHAYAIPTMQGGVGTIKPYVDEFIEFAKAHSELKFLVTRIGCGIAGFKDEQIAPLFQKALSVFNIYLPKEFYDIIVAPYLAHCFYYGKNVPEDCGAHVGHMYEECWVRFHFDEYDYLLNETLYYIRNGLGDFCADDGVPISMKAILYNRFCHWGWAETPDTFRRWYESIDYTNVKATERNNNRRPMAEYNPLLIGAVIGDIVGSIYEFNPHKSKDINLQDSSMEYTDDTIMTIAVADWILNDKKHTKKGLVARMQKWGRRYPNPMGAYGGMFSQWLSSDNPKPYNSWGNGAAMRVAAVGFAFQTLDETLKVAKKSAEVTHNHPEGIKGAQATAAAIFMARTGGTKEEIRRYISETFGYDMNRTCDDIRPTYCFDGSCQGTVPESIIAFLDSKDYEDALRLCISLGGDADTMGTITGAIAGAYYHQIPYDLYEFGVKKLPGGKTPEPFEGKESEEDIIDIINKFDNEYAHDVSFRWKNPEYDADNLIRKVKSGEIFI
jgi:ADP-ribosylglycohydrolase